MKRLLLVIFLLASCGPPSLSSGVIIQKIDVPARDWVYMMPIPHEECYTTGYGKNESEHCTTYYTYIPIPEHDPEHWQVVIHGCDKDGCRDQTVDVSEDKFDQLNIGDEIRVK